MERNWQRWDSNPRLERLVPKTSALDHSATLPFGLPIYQAQVDHVTHVDCITCLTQSSMFLKWVIKLYSCNLVRNNEKKGGIDLI